MVKFAKTIIKSVCYSSVLLLTLFLSACSKPETKSVSTAEVQVSLKTLQSLAGIDTATIEFIIADGWHIYGPEKQQNGRPSSIILFADQIQINKLAWPATTSFNEGLSGHSEGYSGQMAVVAELQKLPEQLVADISWVACKDICVPGEAKLQITTQ